MWTNFIITLEIVLPFVIFLILGAFLRRAKVLKDDFTAEINRFLSAFLLPCNIFNSLYQRDISDAFRRPTAIYIMAGTFLAAMFMMFLASLLEKDPGRQGAMAHGSFRGNVIVFALPLCQSIFGEDVPEITVALAVSVLMNNLVSVPMLEYYRGKKEGASSGQKTTLGGILLHMAKTPLLIGLLLGIFWSVLKIPMPQAGRSVLSSLAGTVIPLAFMTLGARLRISHFRSNSRNVLLACLIKLVILPAVFLLPALLFGWDEKSLVAVVMSFAVPTAIIVYPMTEEYGCDGEMAGEIVTVSTALSVITLFLWIFGMKQTGLIP